MREAAAMLRASWMAASSYRIRLLLSLASLMVTVVPLYFVAGAIQPVVEESIRTEGSEYFTFLLVGMVASYFLTTAINTLPASLGGAISSGTFEVMLSTPTRIPALLAGYLAYPLAWTGVQTTVLLGAALLFGAEFAWQQLPAAVLILAMIVLSYLPFGIISAAAVLAFRTPTPLGRGVLVVSTLLGGVYYSTRVIPSWLQHISDFVPLTYGLRALRRTLLEGFSLKAVAGDLAILLGAIVLLFGLSGYLFAYSLRYARRAGTLSQY